MKSKGRPRNSLMQEVTTRMREKRINNMVDRKNGEEKQNFSGRKMCKHRYSVYIGFSHESHFICRGSSFVSFSYGSYFTPIAEDRSC